VPPPPPLKYGSITFTIWKRNLVGLNCHYNFLKSDQWKSHDM
jgi:hypothetical protein